MFMLNKPVKMMLRRPARQSLAESVAEAISDAIAAARLKPGDRLVETAVADDLKVSRVPVREALKILHAQGILSGGAHKGYRVVSFSSKQVQHVLEVRIALETVLLRDALETWREGKSDVAILDGPLSAMRAAVVAGDEPNTLKADLEFHRAICNAADNDIARTLWDAIARHVLIIFSLEQSSADHMSGIVDLHERFQAFILEQLRNPGPLICLRAAVEDHVCSVGGPRTQQ